MTLRQARTIDELYDEVADYDLVLTTDAPLSLALNRRLDHPRLGRFAATPRMLASGSFRPHDDRQLFFELIERTDLRWKHADYLLENVLGCWAETGELEAILEYEHFDTPETREALAVIEDCPSAHRDLAGFAVDEDLSVAVIGEAHFTALDRTILPAEYDTVSPFSDDSFDLPPFRLFDSATAIVDALVENVAPENAADVAVVMDRSSPYPALVESAFGANGIPYHGGPGFADDEGVRACLRLLRAAHGASHVRVADVRPILSFAGVEPSIADDRKRLDELDDPMLEPLQRFCDSAVEATFDEVVDTVERWGECSLAAFRDELEHLGLRDRRVTESRVDDLAYYLQSFDVPVDRADAGVLLADATAASYVDRPLVCFLGMDAGWTHSIPRRPWIDAAAKDREYLEQFQVLVQNGSAQYYLVQETSGGKPVTPCLYLHDLLDEPVETFADLPHVRHSRFRRDEPVGFEREPIVRGGPSEGGHGRTIEIEPTSIDTLSQSSLNTFVNCPRDYCFDRLVDGPGRDYFRKGNLYHDFAEFYANDPAFVAALDRHELVDLALTAMGPFVDEVDLEPLATEFHVGFEIVATFLDDSPPEERHYDTYERNFSDNCFAEHFERPITSPVTEQWFENRELGAKGKVDLLHTPTRLLDYKSGRRKSASSIVRRSSLDPIHDEPNFQALLYLAHHRRERPDERLEFVFFHFLELVDDAIATADSDAYDFEDALVRITYHPTSFAAYAGSREAFDALREGVAESNDRRKTLERLGYEAYATVFERHPIPDVDDVEALLASDFATRFVDLARAEVGEYAYVTNGIESALATLLRIRARSYFADDVDAFESFLAEQIERINEHRGSSFPVGEPNADRLHNRDLIRTDERGGSDR